jgi:hypothetical protein
MKSEIEKVQHAKRCIDCLKLGLDPNTDGEITDGTALLNDAKLIRALFFAAEALGKYLAHLEKPEPQPNTDGIDYASLAPFALTDEQKATVPFSDKPLGITDFTANINKPINVKTTKKLGVQTLTKHLLDCGYLTNSNQDGKLARLPTDKGKSIGITIEIKNGRDGLPYKKVLYSKAAQELIVASLV